MLIALVKTTSAFASAHLVVTAVSVANSIYNTPAKEGQDTSGTPAVDPATIELSLRCASAMYSGAGVPTGVLAPACSFIDAVAICHGTLETRECFRALQWMSPTLVTPPKVLSAVSTDGITTVALAMETNYAQRLAVKSLLLVTLDPANRITCFEEQWNNVPLMNSVLFRMARRLNGLISFGVTPLVFRR